MQVQGTNTNKRNDYTSSYEQYKQSTIENVTLAEDLIIANVFEDIPDVKFFYRSSLPEYDDIESEPELRYGGASTANYITLTVPNNVLWSTICPEVQQFYVNKTNNWCYINDTKVVEGMEHEHSLEEKFYFEGMMKFELAGPESEEDYEIYNMIVLPGEYHSGVYKIVKGTIFLVEMLGGNNRVDKGRIVAISANQNPNVEDAGIAVEIEGEGTSVKRGSASAVSKGSGKGKKTTKKNNFTLDSSKGMGYRTYMMRDRLN